MTMACRVRGYVVSGKTSASKGQFSTQRQTSAGRKALATMGRRGAETTNKRRWADRSRPDAQAALQPLKKANQKRQWKGGALEGQVRTMILQWRVDLDRDPSTKEIAAEFGVRERRVRQIRQTLGMQARRGGLKRK
ncbi:hypothetical protein [Corynebacterium sp. CCM 9203]|uniref:hypothetical protein n=1 Tax=Corynebacterium sp. CCM 9203 TaxID=3057615 RepID=UPI0035231C11